MRATKTVGLLMMALSVLVAPAVLAEHLVGTVVDISDGDTVRIRADGIHKIRLKGIDAPEMSQPFGPESRQHLVELTFMKRVAAECPERDHYGRLICTLYATDPECNDPWCALEYDVNLAQLEASQACPRTDRRTASALRIRRKAGAGTAGRALVRAGGDAAVGMAAAVTVTRLP